MKLIKKLDTGLNLIVPAFIILLFTQIMALTDPIDINFYKKLIILSTIGLIIYLVFYYIQQYKTAKTIVSVLFIPIKLLFITYIIAYAFGSYYLINNDLKYFDLKIPNKAETANFIQLKKINRKLVLSALKIDESGLKINNLLRSGIKDLADIKDYDIHYKNYEAQMNNLMHKGEFYANYKVNDECSDLTGFRIYTRLTIIKMEYYLKIGKIEKAQELFNNYYPILIKLLDMKTIDLVGGMILSSTLDDISKFLYKNKTNQFRYDKKKLISSHKNLYEKIFKYEAEFSYSLLSEKINLNEFVMIPLVNIKATKNLNHKIFTKIINEYKTKELNSFPVITLKDKIINPVGSYILSIGIPQLHKFNKRWENIDKLLKKL